MFQAAGLLLALGTILFILSQKGSNVPAPSREHVDPVLPVDEGEV
jgi:hypothetical protein